MAMLGALVDIACNSIVTKLSQNVTAFCRCNLIYIDLLHRALCRLKLLPVTHVLVDTWMLTVKPVYKLLNVSDDLK